MRRGKQMCIRDSLCTQLFCCCGYFTTITNFFNLQNITESLNPFSCPALRKRRFGILVSISIRHSVDKSVAVISSSCIDDLSHSTCITYSLIKSEMQTFNNVQYWFCVCIHIECIIQHSLYVKHTKVASLDVPVLDIYLKLEYVMVNSKTNKVVWTFEK